MPRTFRIVGVRESGGQGRKVKRMGETTANTTEKAPKTTKKGWFKGLKAEFKKIVWPDRDSLVKQSAAVIMISIILSLVIAALDAVIKFGINVLPIV